MAGLSTFLLGAPGQTTKIERFTPEQKAIFQKLGAMGAGGLERLNLDFAPIRQKALTEFKEDIVPSLAHRLTQMGGLADPRAMEYIGQAGGRLEEGLAAQESQYGLDKAQMLQNLTRLGLEPQFESIYSPEGPGFLETAGTGLAGMLGQAAPSILGRLTGLGAQAQQQRPAAGLAGAAATGLGALTGQAPGALPAAAGAAGTAGELARPGLAAKAGSTLNAFKGLYPALGVVGGGLGFMKLLQHLVRRKGNKRRGFKKKSGFFRALRGG